MHQSLDAYMADPSHIEDTTVSLHLQEWIATQDLLKRKLVIGDDFTWTVSSQGGCSEECSRMKNLRYIGGVDVSFLKEYPSLACGALVVVDTHSLEVVHEEFDVVKLEIPYVPGFLAFREAPVFLGLLAKMRRSAYHFFPQLLMVDGNGLLHPRGFGSACHIGVLANLPTIGIGKNLLHVDGLTQSGVRQLLEAREIRDKDLIPLVGNSGQTWGVAIRSARGLSRPIYVSVGHRISLQSAIAAVKLCCKFRIPEPIRQADIRSRLFLQKLKTGQHMHGNDNELKLPQGAGDNPIQLDDSGDNDMHGRGSGSEAEDEAALNDLQVSKVNLGGDNLGGK